MKKSQRKRKKTTQPSFAPPSSSQKQSAPKPVPMAARPQSVIPLIALTVIVGFVMYLIYNTQEPSQSVSIVLLVLSILFFVFVFSLSITFLTLLPRIIPPLRVFLRKHSRLSLITFVALVLVIIGGVKLYKRTEYWRSKDDLILLQEFLARGVFAKSVGDSIVSDQLYPEGWTFEDASKEATAITTEIDKIEVTSMFGSYSVSINSWLDDIASAVAGEQDWYALPDFPGVFDITLDDREMKDALKNSVELITGLKESGDDAILRKDRDAMRYIAARLAVQQQWLDNLEYAHHPGLLTFSSSVYADSKLKTAVPRNPCIGEAGNMCLRDVRRIIPGVYRSALGYSVGDPVAEQSWTDSWDEASPGLEEAGYPVGGVGLHQGEPDQPAVSDRLQDFYDECKAKGGTINSSGVKERLPTTESGYTCKYGDNEGCWDFLTYSYRRFMGGNRGCPEQGLVPEVKPSLIDSILDPIRDLNPFNGGDSKYKWDGTYTVSTTGGSCNVPYVNYTTLSPYSYEVVVKHNQIVTAGYDNIPIDENGRASINFSVTESGITVNYTDTMVFSENGTVSGSFHVSGGGAPTGIYVSVTCQGTYTGRR